MRTFIYWLAGLLIAGVILTAVVTGIYDIASYNQQRTKDAYDLGYRSRTNGVPSTANPFEDQREMVQWLKGWMDAKEQP